MFGFRPLRCLPACPLSHSLSLTECSLWHSLFTTGQTVRYLARTKSHAHSRTKMKVYVDLRICCCSPAFHLHLFRAYPVPWVSFQPSNKVLSLSLSLCAVLLGFLPRFWLPWSLFRPWLYVSDNSPSSLFSPFYIFNFHHHT